MEVHCREVTVQSQGTYVQIRSATHKHGCWMCGIVRVTHLVEAKAGMGKVEVLFASGGQVVHDHYRVAKVEEACNQV